MDIAYDSITKEAYGGDEDGRKEDAAKDSKQPDEQQTASPRQNDLSAEIADTYKIISESAWGTRLSGFWGSVKKQGEQYYKTASEELRTASEQASKNYQGFSDQAQSISLPPSDDAKTESDGAGKDKEAAKEPVEVPESLSADIVKEAEAMFAQFKIGAAARLRQIQKAEDAADEALLKFGTGIRDFLRDAVTITAPEGQTGGDVLFESKDSEGRRVVHATRFDAQLHVIHSNATSFTQDPDSEEYEKWKATFDAEKKTDDIAADLKKYDELRRAMEKLVPEHVEYKDFWQRYYFLRHVIETEEQKRRELLRGTQAEQEEIGWGDDDDEEDDVPTPDTDKPASQAAAAAATRKSTTTPPPAANAPQHDAAATPKAADSGLLKPREERKSNEHSVAGSDASYDIVSGAASRGPDSPKEVAIEKKTAPVVEESDEDDWE